MQIGKIHNFIMIAVTANERLVRNVVYFYKTHKKAYCLSINVGGGLRAAPAHTQVRPYIPVCTKKNRLTAVLFNQISGSRGWTGTF